MCPSYPAAVTMYTYMIYHRYAHPYIPPIIYQSLFCYQLCKIYKYLTTDIMYIYVIVFSSYYVFLYIIYFYISALLFFVFIYKQIYTSLFVVHTNICIYLYISVFIYIYIYIPMHIYTLDIQK